MIEEILIRDLGVIQEAKLEFGSGLTAITGETGAGKTMVLNALGLLLGQRGDSSAVRKGQDCAFVEGRWLLSDDTAEAIRSSDIDFEDSELILSRSVYSEGRSKATLSGRSIPVGILAELGERLVVVHGQSDQIRLRSASAQREALDQFAGADMQGALNDYRSKFQEWKNVASKLETLKDQLNSRVKEAEELRAAVEELETTNPLPGEDQLLAEQAERLSHIEDLRLAATIAHEHLSSESVDASDAMVLVAKARRSLEQVGQHDSKLQMLAEQLKELGSSLNEIAASLSGYLSSVDSDSANQLSSIQERRASLNQLMRKYGPSLDEVIAYKNQASNRLLELDSSTEEIERLTAEESKLQQEVRRIATGISKTRNAAASELSEKVSGELEALAMAGASFEVQVTSSEELKEFGQDQVTMSLVAYPGAEPRPIGKGASGGELSRIMLAIEVVLAQRALAPTFIFDEVDAGVGGAAATEVGKRLARLAKSAQVIVVTHLPQVAAFAGTHLRVLKSSSSEFTASDVVKLDGQARVEELTRMLSGLSESESGRTHAQELLELAEATN